MKIEIRATPSRRRARRIALALAATLCCVFAAVALAAEGQLSFVECLKDTGSASSCSDQGATVDGLDGTQGVSISPDGKNVYTVSLLDDAVAVFARNPTTGALSFVECLKDTGSASSCSDQGATVDGLDGALRVATSPDGNSVYVTSSVDDAVAVFARNPTSGTLDYVETQKDGVDGVDGLDNAIGITTSPDGNSVYVASIFGAVVVFDRNPTSGALTFVEAQNDSDPGVDGLSGAGGVSTSPDGRNIYVASSIDNALATFDRNPTSGALTFVEAQNDTDPGVDGLDGARGVTTSPDGKSVYVASRIDDAVAIFDRNPTTGALTYAECLKDTGSASSCSDRGATVDGLDTAVDVSISADGKSVYVAAGTDRAIAVFGRNPTSGGLTYIEVKKDGVGGVDGLSSAGGVTVSPDGKSVYGASFGDDAVAVFSREPDTEPDTTAPETTITSGPTGNTTDSSPSFGFSSDDPGSTAGFECRVDGGPFSDCTSPTTIGPLDLGPHTFAVRATDTVGNSDPSPALRSFAVVAPDWIPGPGPTPTSDTEVTDPDVSAKKVQKLRRKVKVKVKAGAQEAVDLVGKGRVTVKKKGSKGSKGGSKSRGKGTDKSFKLKTVRKSTEQGEQTVLRLKPKKKDAKKILKLLKKGKDLRANPSVELTDEAGNSATEKRVVRLKLKGKQRS